MTLCANTIVSLQWHTAAPQTRTKGVKGGHKEVKIEKKNVLRGKKGMNLSLIATKTTVLVSYICPL